MSDVFISYSRKDKDFVRQLHDALAARQQDVWVDWEDIPPTADWHAEIFAAIQSANSFIFVLSPDSIASQVCGEELAHAVKQQKRLVPIVCREVNPQSAPLSVSSLNWIFFRPTDDFNAAFATLITALNTDLDWVKAHTRLLMRASEWENKKKNDAFVLRGADLRTAEEWLSIAATGKEPKPTPLQSEYILASRKSATRQQRTILTGVTIALVVAIGLGCLASVLGLFAWDQSNVATNQKNTAVAERNVRATAEINAVNQANARATAEAQAISERNIAQARELAANSISLASGNPECRTRSGSRPCARRGNRCNRSAPRPRGC